MSNLTCKPCADKFCNNTGYVCAFLGATPEKILVQYRFDSAGNENYLDLAVLNAAPFNGNVKAYLQSLIEETDKSKRLYPYPTAHNFEPTADEQRSQQVDVNKFIELGQGQRSMVMTMHEVNHGFIDVIKKHNCHELVVYIVDINGNIRGFREPIDKGNVDTSKLYGSIVQKSRFYGTPITATSENVEAVQLTMFFDLYQSDGDVRLLETKDRSVLRLTGLITAIATISNITGTSFDLQVITETGAASGLIIDSLGSTDVVLTNETTQDPVTITSMTFDEDEKVYKVIHDVIAAENLFSLALSSTPKAKKYDAECFKVNAEVPA
jgi:hypothetical protein